jgi:hypothetical protein
VTAEGYAQPARKVAPGVFGFFAVLYFVQSVGDPTSGLVAQPVRSLLRSWGESPAALGALMALLAIPWSLKPVFGLLSDFVPLFGSRRRSYLLPSTAIAALSLLALALIPLAPGSRGLLFALLLPTTLAIALGDVIVDALMVEKGQPLGLTGRLQSIQWTAANAALLLTGVVGGYVAEGGLQSLAFALCAVLWMLAFAVAWGYARENHEEHLTPESFRDTASALLGVFREPLFLAVCGLLTLWSFNPVWGSVLYLHMTEGLGFRAAVRQPQLGVLRRVPDRQRRLRHLLQVGEPCSPPSPFHFGGHRLKRHLLAIEQLDLRLCRLAAGRDHVHDRHPHSTRPGGARDPCPGRGDGVRDHHGAHQFRGLRLGGVRRLAVRDGKGLARARDGIQRRGLGERRRGDELLAARPRSAPRRAGMVARSAHRIGWHWSETSPRHGEVRGGAAYSLLESSSSPSPSGSSSSGSSSSLRSGASSGFGMEKPGGRLESRSPAPFSSLRPGRS